MAVDHIASIEALLVETETAHGVHESTELNGVYDQEWPSWYAAYAVEHGMGALLGRDVTPDELARFLATSSAELEQIEPTSRDPWPAYTARRIAAEL